MLKTVAFFGFLGCAQSQSVTSCGAAGDHFSNVKITLSPDPPELGQPLNFKMEGDLDKALTGGNAIVDLNIKALRIINEPVNVSSPFTYSPGVVSGHSTITVGPVNLPKLYLPGGVDVTGTVKITNTKKEPVACIQLDLKVGGASDTSALEQAQGMVDGSPVSDCTKASDHMKNFNFSDDTTGMTTITGTLDEDLDTINVAADLSIKIPLVPLPEIKLNVPASISPVVKKGDLKITVGPVASAAPANSGINVTVNGNIKVNDGNTEEIVCLQIGSALVDTAAPLQCKSASYAFCCELGKPCDCTKGTVSPGQCEESSYAFCCSVGAPCDCTQPPLPDFMQIMV